MPLLHKYSAPISLDHWYNGNIENDSEVIPKKTTSFETRGRKYIFLNFHFCILYVYISVRNISFPFTYISSSRKYDLVLGLWW